MSPKRDIYVYMDWFEYDEPIFMGMLRSERLRGKEVFYYENNPDWLKYSHFRNLDPDLTAFTGKQFLPVEKKNFGLFLDSSPDRWGRTLLQRREAIVARREGRAARNLSESDFLMSVFDGTRMGALRFKFSKEGEFMDNNRYMATPPSASLRELEYASQLIESEGTTDTEYIRWLNMLIAPGSSLGGARPKANILDNDGQLWIAKFPGNHDNKDIAAWEYVSWKIARLCGINMSESRLQKLSSRHHTFLTKRFDRTNDGKRVHFASAMTMLGHTDGESHLDGISYLEMVEWIIANCENMGKNLEQLWRRVVYNIAVSNCDDHLRNHGFILNKKGWQLSPAYDINPDEYGTGLKLNVSEHDNSLNFDLALSVAPYFHLNAKKANQILAEIRNVVSQWSRFATECGIAKSEQEQVSGAYRY
jgi:serine/threonine-protein kinase HipA